MDLIEILKALLLGIVEGITEWLPISSTGHMILVDEFVHMDVTPEFREMFLVVIQIGAILAVVCLFWKRMWPFCLPTDDHPYYIRHRILWTWFKVVVACIPGAVVTLLFDDWVEEHLKTPVVIAAALILYGIAFLIIENPRLRRKTTVSRLFDLSYKDALLIGCFQVLSIIPGTSRSGSTILGALLLGIDRTVAAEFTFFLAVPVMLGYGGLKLLKFGFSLTLAEGVILAVGCLVAFLVSLVVVRFLMAYIKKHDFRAFGWYRIGLGALVLLYFLVFAR